MKEFIFDVTQYDSGLAVEVEQVLRAETERKSRSALPKMWAVTDKMNTIQQKSGGKPKPKTSGYLLTFFLFVAGLFVFIPGLQQAQKFNVMTVFGAILLLIGVIRLLPKGRGQKKQAERFRKGADTLLTNLNSADPAEQPQVVVTNSGLSIRSASDKREMPFDELTAVYETEHLWAAVCGDAITVVQKDDLLDAEPSEVTKFLRKRIKNKFEKLNEHIGEST